MGRGRGKGGEVDCCGCCELSDDSLYIIGGVSACIVVITSVVLFAVSFSTLEPTEVGIKYNNNLVEIDTSRIYNNGRYFLGLGLWFIKFPTNVQTIEFKGTRNDIGQVEAWSKEGQNLYIELDIGYRLQRDQIVPLYLRYRQDYHNVFIKIVLRVIKQVCTEYTADQFFDLRVQIAAAMKQAVRARLKAEFATLEVFNLRAIDLPDAFENKIVEKVVKAQEVQTATNIALTNQLRARISVIRAQGDADVNVLLAKANADRVQLIQGTQASGLARLRQQEATSYAKLQDALGLNSTDLLQYRWAQITGMLEKEYTSNKMLHYMVGFQEATVRVL